MKRAIVLMILLAGASVAISATIHVPADQPTIQAGINAASNYDTVLVADGVYIGDGNWDISLHGKPIKLMSENGPEHTIIDCIQNPGDLHRGFYIKDYETPETLVRGFTVRNGSVEGGGMRLYHTSVTIENCIIRDNGGGGIRCYASYTPTLDSVIFIDNYGWNMTVFSANAELYNCEFKHAYVMGRGIWCTNNDSLVLDNCLFQWNEFENGAGIFAEYESHLYLTDCVFDRNTSTVGSAIHLDFGRCSLDMTGCEFTWNHSYDYGTIYAYESPVNARDCLFKNNRAARTAWMVRIEDPRDSVRFSNCRFELNRGVSLSVSDRAHSVLDSCTFVWNESNYAVVEFNLYDSSPYIRNCTFAQNVMETFNDNPGHVVLSYLAPPTLNNSIIAFNDTAYAFLESFYAPTLSCCNIYGNQYGDWIGDIADQLGVNGNISEDPLFCDVSELDYRLQNSSPCAPENNECGVLIGAGDVGCHLCGDSDGNGEVGMADIVNLLNYVFMNDTPPDPIEVSDVDCSDNTDIDDIVYLIQYLFAGGLDLCLSC